MKATLHAAFWKTWKARAWMALPILIAMVPELTPAGIVEWFRAGVPWIPESVAWPVALAVTVFRILVVVDRSIPADVDVEDRRRR